MKRTALARRTPLRRLTRLRPRSKKREREMVKRRELVTQITEAFPRCMFPTYVSHRLDFPGDCITVRGCQSRTAHLHEILSRGRGGSFLDEANVLPVCFDHHRWIHDHPQKAEALGVFQHSWDRQGTENA